MPDSEALSRLVITVTGTLFVAAAVAAAGNASDAVKFAGYDVRTAPMEFALAVPPALDADTTASRDSGNAFEEVWTFSLTAASDEPPQGEPTAAEPEQAAPPDGGASDTELAKKTQNPVSDLISLPFENNAYFGVGSKNRVQYTLIVKPVIPMSLNADWNWIHRAIIPVTCQPELGPGGLGEACGLGDIQYQGYLSPAKLGAFIWGVGPVFQFPSATEDVLGTEKWSMGPGAVVLRMDGPWVYGGLINNIWSICGDSGRKDVNVMLIQPFLNYNLPEGWFITSAPIITANWEADSGNRWTVPLGGGMGKVFRIGKLPVSVTTQAYYNVEKPDGAADWSLRFQFAFLFPK